MPDQVWLRQHVLTTVKRATLAGESLSAEQVQQLAGVGPADAAVALGLLVDEGSLVEGGGNYEASQRVLDGEQAPNGAAGLLAPEEAPEGPSEMLARVHAAQQATVGAGMSPELIEAAAALIAGRNAAPAVDSSPRRVTLSAAIVSVLQPEQIGAMVLAGMADAQQAGAVFELIVEP